MATRTSLSTVARQKLADVTNLPGPPPRNENVAEVPMGDKDRVEQLTRERMALFKLVTERNKIIELSGAELQKLRVSVQKLQLQNWNLARSNSQMLAELNSRRDAVKTLQHELLCKEALLKAKNFEMQENLEINCQKAGSKFKEADEATLHEADDDKPRIGNKRHATRSQSVGVSTKFQKVEKSLTQQGKEEMKCQTTACQLIKGEEPALQDTTKDENQCVGNKAHATRSQSLGSSIKFQKVEQSLTQQGKEEITCQTTGCQLKGEEPALRDSTKDENRCVGNKRRATRSQSLGASTACQNIEQKDKVENKRRSLRRQSSRFKSHEEEQMDNLFEIEEAKFPENSMLEDDPIPSISSIKPEEKEDSCATKSGVSQRSPIGRPLCKAVKKDTKFAETFIPNGDPAPLILSTSKDKAEISAPKSEGVSQRCSIGRPLRRAVEKVQSYKEPPLKIKMRRIELPAA
ncbi:SHUGOSHIN 2 isoform X2 [Argentina anserina]|uniref:SHUGOSHIN 2 isoform X2 n=2 Tax=Argentina anserina TaxID=57926 RepID=UPI002176329F|nr:SHUGOSHIN 2 isoform X2 [Potentilla anserina]